MYLGLGVTLEEDGEPAVGPHLVLGYPWKPRTGPAILAAKDRCVRLHLIEQLRQRLPTPHFVGARGGFSRKKPRQDGSAILLPNSGKIGFG